MKAFTYDCDVGGDGDGDGNGNGMGCCRGFGVEDKIGDGVEERECLSKGED